MSDRYMHRSVHSFLTRFTTIAFALCTSYLCVAQNQGSASVHTSEGDIAVPTAAVESSPRTDDAAVQELIKHKAVVGPGWTGMQAQGVLTFAGDATSYNAVYTNLGTDRFRLDYTGSKGTTSLRIDHQLGRVKRNDTTATQLSLNATMIGIFPFELLRTAMLSNKNLAIHDHGVADIGGVQLHRISAEHLTVGRDPKTNQWNRLAVDYYFDPSSHLLVKSVASVPTGDRRIVKLLSVVTYSDYRSVGTSSIPFRFSETLQGAPYQTLQLSSVTLSPAVDASFFTF